MIYDLEKKIPVEDNIAFTENAGNWIDKYPECEFEALRTYSIEKILRS